MFRVLFCIAPLLGLLVFPEHRTHFVLPAVANLLLLPSAFLLLKESREWRGTAPMMLLVNSVLAVVWLLSERHEGRVIASMALPLEIVLAGLGTMWTLKLDDLRPEHSFALFGFLLVFSVGYSSTGTGSSGGMMTQLLEWGLTQDQAHLVTLVIRKSIHCFFYSCVFWLMYRHFLALCSPLRASLLAGLLVTLSVASIDEFRQSLVPNRTGSVWDVFLDMGAAGIVLVLSLKSQERFAKINAVLSQSSD
jgi:VanZ family protein